jgi:hypothetical protein
MIGSCLCILSHCSLCGMVEHAKPEQVELRATLHAAFDQLEPIDVSISRVSN